MQQGGKQYLVFPVANLPLASVGSATRGRMLGWVHLWSDFLQLFLHCCPHFWKSMEIMTEKDGSKEGHKYLQGLENKCYDLQLKELNLFSSLTRSWDVTQSLSIDTFTQKRNLRTGWIFHTTDKGKRKKISAWKMVSERFWWRIGHNFLIGGWGVIKQWIANLPRKDHGLLSLEI